MGYLKLSTTPNFLYKLVRLIWHYLTIPYHMMVGLVTTVYSIIVHNVKTKIRPYSSTADGNATLSGLTIPLYNKLPIWKTAGFETYVNNVPYYHDQNTGYYHASARQCYTQGIYAHVMSKLGKRTALIDAGLGKHVQGVKLSNGYRINPFNKEIIYNFDNVTNETLTGLSLGMLDCNKRDNALATDTSIGQLKESFDTMLAELFENDMSLLQYVKPREKDLLEIYEKLEQENEKLIVKKKMKNLKANYAPGFVTGLDALTLLAATRIGDKVIGASYAKRKYTSLLRMGYGLLGLFPKVNESRRDQSQAMIDLYILSRLSDGWLGRTFWKMSMKLVWNMSKKHYNAFFTGLLNEAHPKSVSDLYLSNCLMYVIENDPLTYSYTDSSFSKADSYPIALSLTAESEFFPDTEQTLIIPNDLKITEEDKTKVLSGIPKVKVGLGWLTSMAMLVDNPEELLDEEQTVDVDSSSTTSN